MRLYACNDVQKYFQLYFFTTRKAQVKNALTRHTAFALSSERSHSHDLFQPFLGIAPQA
jgi:hypothetical protein